MGNLLSCERRASRSSASLLDADDVALWWGRLQDPGVGGADTSRTHRAKRHQDIMQRGGFELGMAEAITFLEQNAVLGKTKLVSSAESFHGDIVLQDGDSLRSSASPG